METPASTGSYFDNLSGFLSDVGKNVTEIKSWFQPAEVKKDTPKNGASAIVPDAVSQASKVPTWVYIAGAGALALVIVLAVRR
jgi:hypothetical protein